MSATEHPSPTRPLLPWQWDFPYYRYELERALGRPLTRGEVARARNAYSHRLAPAGLAALIRSGR